MAIVASKYKLAGGGGRADKYKLGPGARAGKHKCPGAFIIHLTSDEIRWSFY